MILSQRNFHRFVPRNHDNGYPVVHTFISYQNDRGFPTATWLCLSQLESIASFLFPFSFFTDGDMMLGKPLTSRLCHVVHTSRREQPLQTVDMVELNIN